MKMVASSKLHKAQGAIESMRPYEQRLSRMTATFVANLNGTATSPYAIQREVKQTAIVVFSSNSSLCGAFNANVAKELSSLRAQLAEQGVEGIRVVTFGRKVTDAARKYANGSVEDHSNLLDHPVYAPVAEVAESLMQDFVQGRLDRIIVVYHHFKNSASQILTTENLLPIQLDGTPSEEQQEGMKANYIVEPSPQRVLDLLIPKALHLKLYTALLDSLASEHAARVIAMQVATDNADDLLSELRLTYNKTRQQAITSELLDIVGGSMQ